MARKDRRDEQPSATPSPENAADAAAPGSTILDATPSTEGAKGTSDNPVRQLSRDAGDVLADEVREGWWNTPMEERDRARGR